MKGFNAHHRHWFDLGGLTTNHGLIAKYFTKNSGCEQLITGTTHRDVSCLDLLFNESFGIITIHVCGFIDSSDHCSISAKIKISQFVPNVSFPGKNYVKSRADLEDIDSDPLNLDWCSIHKHAEVESCVTDHFSNIIERRIPSRIIEFRIKDKA